MHTCKVGPKKEPVEGARGQARVELVKKKSVRRRRVAVGGYAQRGSNCDNTSRAF